MTDQPTTRHGYRPAGPATPGTPLTGPAGASSANPPIRSVPCGGHVLRRPHPAHDWAPQPGMTPVHCPGVQAASGADSSRTVRVLIDPNVRLPGGRTRAGLEDADGPIVTGQTVEVWEAESGVRGPGRVSWIDEGKRLVYLSVDWAQLRAEDTEPTSDDAADNPGALTLDRATATMLRDTLNALLGDASATPAAPDVSGGHDHQACGDCDLLDPCPCCGLRYDAGTGQYVTAPATPDGLRSQYSAAIDEGFRTFDADETEDAYLIEHLADAVLAVRDRRLEQLTTDLATADRIRAEAKVDRDRLAAELAAVGSAASVAALEDITVRSVQQLTEVRADRDRLAAKVDYARGQVVQMSERAEQAEAALAAVREYVAHSDDDGIRIRETVLRLYELHKLEAGWLEGAGEAVSRRILRLAESLLLELLDAGVRRPFIYPTETGGVQLEWSSSAGEVTAEVNSAEGIEIYAYSNNSDEELEASFNSHQLEEAAQCLLGEVASEGLVCLAVQDQHLEQLAAGRETWRAKALEMEADRDRLDRTRPTTWAYEQACKALEKHRLRAEQAEATVARVRALAADMRTWCSYHNIAIDYADRIDAALDGKAGR